MYKLKNKFDFTFVVIGQGTTMYQARISNTVLFMRSYVDAILGTRAASEPPLVLQSNPSCSVLEHNSVDNLQQELPSGEAQDIHVHVPGKDLSEPPLSPNGIDSHAKRTEEVLESSTRSHTPTSIPGTATPKNKGII